MKRTVEPVGTWFRKVYDAFKRAEEAMDYRYEDYAETRFRKIEQRLATLENQLRK